MTNNLELSVGDKVPDFVLLSDQNKQISIEDFKGKNVVVYFYPKDDTPGCTVEAKDFTCLIDEFNKLDTVIIGISKDNIKSHEKFKTKHNLAHILLADTEVEVANKFHSWGEKSLYGRKYMAVLRNTFLINKNGIIHKIWSNVKVKDHAEEVLKEIKSMEG